MPFKKEVKQIFSAIGANEWVIRGKKSELLVLCYHGVLAERRPDRWSYDNWVDAASFREQLRWLKQILEVTDLAGVRRWHEGKWRGPKGPALITFDDGYRNNVTQAAPILLEESLPAIFFLASGYVGTSRVLWLDEIRVQVLNWPEPSVRLPSGETREIPSDLAERRRLANETVEGIKQLTEEPCRSYCDYLRSKTEQVELMDDFEARSFMSWDDARKLREMGFEIGAHTVNHPILSKIAPERLASELAESKAMIERELNFSSKALAYPNGSARDVNEQVFAETEKAGFEWAFTTAAQWQKPGVNPYQIGRICVVGHTDLATFKFYASGLHTRIMGAA
jgi:peptidoglycan/xylan/chitin deacetylase (PgdA/CDA1 family)